MADMLDLLFMRTWWRYGAKADWYATPYHWFNLIEGGVWLVIAALILRRSLEHRGSRVEWLYAFSFLTFALSDFREAFIVHSWLILFKALNLAAILYLRGIVLHRFYPQSRAF